MSDEPPPTVDDTAALAAHVGRAVRVIGRYEAFDQGRHRLIGPDGPTAWLCELALPRGGWLRLGARPDEERLRLLGRDVIARGRVVRPDGGPADATPPHAAPADATPPHVAPADAAQADAALTLVDAAIEPASPLFVDDGLPPGAVGTRTAEVVITYLEMDADRAPAVDAPAGAAVVTAAPMTVRFYRYLYDAVGAPWHWYYRKRQRDDELAAILATPGIEVHVAYDRGTPAGYVELDRTVPGACEITYFGLVPEAIGRGLGRWFLAWAIHTAWRDPALRRLWVHTCTLDGAAALPTYQRAGFRPYKHTRYRQLLCDP